MKTVLIIEDNLEIRENTAELLELEGYFVIAAIHGKEGHELAKKKLPDAIICDIRMPELNGYQLYTLLKEDAATSNIPFIFASVCAEKKEIQAGLDMGADGYLTQPFTLEILLTELKRCLNK
jgi:CheY-like chemotaxis protein